MIFLNMKVEFHLIPADANFLKVLTTNKIMAAVIDYAQPFLNIHVT